MQRRKVLKAPPKTLVSKAAKLMADKNVGAVMVVEDERLVGIFTERDIAFRVVAQGLDARTTRLADVMTPAPDTVDPDKPFGYALLLMHEGFSICPWSGLKLVGIVSSRSAMDQNWRNSRSKHGGKNYFRATLRHITCRTDRQSSSARESRMDIEDFVQLQDRVGAARQIVMQSLRQGRTHHTRSLSSMG
jgi:predicted transcriptional regulator